MSLNSSAVLTKTLPLLSTRGKLCRDRAAVFVQPCAASSPSACFTSRRDSRDAATTNHSAACFLEVCTPLSSLTSHPRRHGLLQVRLSLCIPGAPYLSRQAMGSAAKPRHMLRAGHPGIQQLMGSWQGGEGVQQAAAAPPAPRCALEAAAAAPSRALYRVGGGRAGRGPQHRCSLQPTKSCSGSAREEKSLGKFVCAAEGGRSGRPQACP